MAFDHSDSFLLFACKKCLGVISLKQETPELTELTNWAGNNYSLLCLGSQPQVVIAGLQNGQVISFKTVDKSSNKTSEAGNPEINFAFDTILMDQHRGPCGSIWPTKQVKGFLTAGFDGSVIQWDAFLNRIQKIEIQTEFPFKLSTLKIKAICEDPLTGEIVFGNRAGDILELKLNDKSYHNNILLKGHMDIVKGIDCLPGRTEIVTIGRDGYLVIRDFEKKKHKSALKLEFEGSQVATNLEGNHIAVGFMNGALQIVDINNAAILRRFYDQKSKISILKYSSTPNNYLLASAAYDGRIIFYRADYDYLKIAVIENVHAPPLSLDFSEDARSVQIVNMNFTLNYYTTEENSQDNLKLNDSSTKRKMEMAEEFKNEVWQTWTSPFGWYVQGLLKDHEFIFKFSCLQRSPDKKFLAVGFQNGNVRFYRYPCLGDNPAFVEYKVYSGPVSAIIFNQNTNSIFTSGKTERNVVHWNYTIADDSYLPVFRYENFSNKIQADKHENTLISLTQRDRKKTKDTDYEILNLRLAEAPDQNLDLKHVFGFNQDTATNISRFTAINSVVFLSGNKVVVEEFGKESKNQSFFGFHKNVVTSLDLNKSKDIVATADLSGDIFVWNFQSKAILSYLKASQVEGISMVKFSSEGTKLLALNKDKSFTLDVFDYVNRRLLNSVKIHEGPIHSISFSSDEEFITVTPDRIRFWQFKGMNLTSTLGDWRPLQATEEEIQVEKKDKIVPEYLTTGIYAFTSNICLTGTSKGRIYIWENKIFKAVVKSSSTASITRMICYRNILYVGNTEGILNTWVEGDNKLILDKPVKTALPDSLTKFGIKSLDIGSNGPFLFTLIGTDTGKLFVSEQQEENADNKKNQSLASRLGKENLSYVPKGFTYVTQSHAGRKITGLAAHQLLPLFVTAGDDGKLILWNATKKQVENVFSPKSNEDTYFIVIDWSSDGEFILAATDKGMLYLFDKTLAYICKNDFLAKDDSDEKITAIKISSSPYSIAVAVEGSQVLYMFDFSSKKKELVYRQSIDAKITGACRSMDWTHDGSYLACSLDTFEQRFVEVRDGSLTSYSSVKDKLWATWTQPLGPTVRGIKLDDQDIRYSPVCRSFKYAAQAKDYETEFDHKPVRLLLAAGDRDGNLGLYRFPCVHPNSDSKSYNAVANRMTHVKIFGNDEFIVAVGENSNSIVVFETDFKNDNKVADNIELVTTNQEEETSDYKSLLENLPKSSSNNLVEELNGNELQPEFNSTNLQKDQKDLMKYIVYPTSYLKPPIHGHLPPKLLLEPVYAFGFRAKDTRDNLKYLNKKEIVYATTSLVIVHNITKKSQKFFMEHKSDVTCFSIRPLERLIASGDVASPPMICVWNADSLSSVSRFHLHGHSGIMKIQFSTEGPLLAAISTDHHSTLSILNFETGFILYSVPGDGKSQRIFDLKWTSGIELVTIGVNHIKFWKVETHRLKDTRGRLDPKTGSQSILCCAMNKKDLLGGTSNGDLLVWRKSQNLTDYPQLFSIFTGTESSNSIEMVCTSEQK
jgi:WD40 repeat protein